MNRFLMETMSVRNLSLLHLTNKQSMIKLKSCSIWMWKIPISVSVISLLDWDSVSAIPSWSCLFVLHGSGHHIIETLSLMHSISWPKTSLLVLTTIMILSSQIIVTVLTWPLKKRDWINNSIILMQLMKRSRKSWPTKTQIWMSLSKLENHKQQKT